MAIEIYLQRNNRVTIADGVKPGSAPSSTNSSS